MLSVMIFGTSEQLFVKNFLVPGETETRNVYSRVCRNKTYICCSDAFFLCWLVLWVINGNWQLFKLIHFKHFVLLQFIYVLSFLTRTVIHADVSLHTVPNPSQKVFLQRMNELFKLFSSIRNGIFKWEKNVFNKKNLFFNLF